MIPASIGQLIASPRIARPQITAPAAAATTALGIVFTSSSFKGLSSSRHDASDWQVSADPAFGTILVEASNSATALTSWSAAVLGSGSYYVRVRHRSNALKLVSDWSESVLFTPVATVSALSAVVAGSSWGGSIADPSGGSGLSFQYQWRIDGSPIGGATASSYSRTVYLGDQSKVISCVITASGFPGQYIASAAALSISDGITLTTSGGLTANAGSAWSASVSPSGTPYASTTWSYQWSFRGSNFNSGGTGSSVSFTAYYSDNGAQVSCDVKATNGANPAEFTVKTANFSMGVNRGAMGPYGGSATWTWAAGYSGPEYLGDGVNDGPVGVGILNAPVGSLSGTGISTRSGYSGLDAALNGRVFWSISAFRFVGRITLPPYTGGTLWFRVILRYGQTRQQYVRLAVFAPSPHTPDPTSVDLDETSTYSPAWTSADSDYGVEVRTYLEAKAWSDPTEASGTLYVYGTRAGFYADTRSANP